jgi:hypothetical protein
MGRSHAGQCVINRTPFSPPVQKGVFSGVNSGSTAVMFDTFSLARISGATREWVIPTNAVLF